MDAGILRVEPADRVDRLDRVATRLLLTCRDREGEAVDDDVLDLHPPLVDEGVDQARCDAHLVVAGARLTLLVDRERDHGRAVLLDERHDASEPAGRGIPVFEVDRVDDRAAADQLEPGTDDVGLGGVDHERKGRRAREARHHLAHVGDAIATDVVDAHVEEVRADADLVARDLDALVPVLGEHRLAERLRPVGVGALPDREVGRVLLERHVLIQARDAGFDLDDAVGTAGLARACARRPELAAGRSRSTTAARCSGVVPQHPPISPSPNSRTNCSCAVASSVGLSG